PKRWLPSCFGPLRGQVKSIGCLAAGELEKPGSIAAFEGSHGLLEAFHQFTGRLPGSNPVGVVPLLVVLCRDRHPSFSSASWPPIASYRLKQNVSRAGPSPRMNIDQIGDTRDSGSPSCKGTRSRPKGFS